MTTDELKFALENGMIDIALLQEKINMAEKAKYLEGVHIWQGKNGLWYTKFQTDDAKKLIKRKTRKELEDEIIKRKKSLEDKPTVDTVFWKWIGSKMEYGEISQSTYDRYLRDYERFIKGSDFSKKPFCDISEEYLSDFIKKTISDQALTAKGYAKLRTLLRGMLLFAKGRYTNISPEYFFGDLTFSKNTFKHTILYKEKQVFMEEEAKRLSDYLQKQNKPHAKGILLTFHTGIRVGELCSLKKEDIILQEDVTLLHVQRTESKIDKKDGGSEYIVIDYPKSSAGDRYVFCDSFASKILLDLKNTANEYLFCNKSGRMNGGMFDRYLRRSCDKIGIPHRSMHKIRKTYGTMLIDGGVDEAIIIEQMGHSDIHCTKQYYYFSNKNRDKRNHQLSGIVTFG